MVKKTTKRVKNIWFYEKNTQLFLHWFWIFGLIGFLAYFSYFFMRTPPTPLGRGSLVMHNPHFYSASTAGDPYHIYAESIQYHASEIFYFIEPRADYTLKRNKVSLGSQKGFWNHQEHILTLRKKVHLRDSRGQHMDTDFAQLMYKKKEIRSHKITRGRGPKGHFQSAGFLWNEETLDLIGPVTFTLYNKDS